MSEHKPSVLRAIPTITIPELPCDGSYSTFLDLFKSPEEIAERDADFCFAHARFLKSKEAQTNALHDLVLARMRVAKTMAELAALPETCRREQEHKLRLLSLRNETEAADAAIALAEARGRLAQSLGGAKPKSTGDGTLSIDDVESILTQFPEIEGDNIGRISMLLRALMREKDA